MDVDKIKELQQQLLDLQSGTWIELGLTLGLLEYQMENRNERSTMASLRGHFYQTNALLKTTTVHTAEESSVMIQQLVDNAKDKGGILEMSIRIDFNTLYDLVEAYMDAEIPLHYARIKFQVEGPIEGRMVKNSEGKTVAVIRAGTAQSVISVTGANNPLGDQSKEATFEELQLLVSEAAEKQVSGYNKWKLNVVSTSHGAADDELDELDELDAAMQNP